MKQMKIWMMAAILTLSGATVLTSCSDNDNPVVNQPTQREQFEQQLTKTLDNAVNYAQLGPTIKGIEILTSFVNQLDGEAVGKQAFTQIFDIMANAYTERHTCDQLKFSDLGSREQEARTAMKSLLGLDDAEQFIVFNAKRSIGDRRITFIQGQKEAVVTEDKAFVVEYQDKEAGESTELSFTFSDAEDGIILWVSKFQGQPVAIQFPENIEFTISTGKTGGLRQVTSGTLALSSTDGTKWFAPKHTGYIATVYVNSSVNGRTEQVVAGLTHSTDGVWNLTSGLVINDHNVLSISASGMRDRYTDGELEQYSSMAELGRGYRYAYDVIRLINVKSIDDLRLTIDDDLSIDCEVKDAAKAIEALGQIHVLRENESTVLSEYEKYTKQLNEVMTFTASQRSTGITGQGTMQTVLFDDFYLPTPSLRFEGETQFQPILERMSDHDAENFATLLETFDEPYASIKTLTEVIEQKGKEIAAVFKF